MDKTAILAEIGHLALAKEAGDISSEEFSKEASRLRGAWEAAKAGAINSGAFAGRAVKGTGKYLNDGLRARGVRDTHTLRKFRKEYDLADTPGLKSKFLNKDEAKGYAKGLAQLAASYGVVGAGAAGAGLGGHAAYKKYKK